MVKSAPKTLVSYAGVVKGKGVKTSFFATTVCDIKVPRSVPNKRIPNTNEKHSFFLDLLNIKATEEEIAKAITLEGILGVKYRADLTIVEFICANEEAQKKALETEFEVVGKAKFVAIAPRHLLQCTVLVKIANVDFGEEANLKEKLTVYWSQFGKVVDAAPHKFPGKPWLTQRWDILITLPEEQKKLKAPVVFKLHGSEQTLLATWPGAPKSCLKCLIAGHETSKCLGKNPKAGGRPDPEKKDQQVAQAKTGQQKIQPEKVPQMGLGKAPQHKPKQTVQSVTKTVSESATISVSATASTSASATVSETVSESVKKSGDSEVEGPELLDDEEEMQVDADLKAIEQIAALPVFNFKNANETRREMVTPPPFTVADPDTPRKGNKRMAKESDLWQPKPTDVASYVMDKGICVRCWTTEHSYKECTAGPMLRLRGDRILAHPKFQPFLQVWRERRRKSGKVFELAQEIELLPDTAVVIEAHCAICWKTGHVRSDCPELGLISSETLGPK
jgi:hypothetical protein